MLGLRSKVLYAKKGWQGEPAEAARGSGAWFAYRSTLRWVVKAWPPRRKPCRREKTTRVPANSNTAQASVSQEHSNAPSIRGALGSSAQCRHRRRQAEGSEAPQHRCPGSLKHLGVPVPLVRQNFFRCTSSSQKQGRTMAGAAMAAVVRRLAAAHARGRARTPVLAKLGMKPVARPTRLHRSPGRGTRPIATPELLPFFGTSSATGPPLLCQEVRPQRVGGSSWREGGGV